MKVITKRIIPTLLSIVFIIVIYMPVLGNIDAILAPVYAATTLNGLNTKLNDIQKRAKTLEAELKNTQNQKKSEMQRKNDLDSKISLCEEEVEILSEKIVELDNEITIKSNDIVKLQDDIDERYDLYKQRIRATYEEGTVSYIEMMLSSKNFIELMNSIEMVTDIVKYDQNLIENMGQSKADLEQIKADLGSNKTEQETSKTQLKDREKKLANDRADSAKLISDLEGDAQAFRKAYDDADNEMQKLQSQIKAELKRIEEENIKKNGSSKYVGGTFTWPTPGYERITSPYGWRTHPIFKDKRFHTGVDVGVPKGKTVVAMNDGTVVKAQYNSAYGNFIVISHGGGMSTMYAHLSSFSVKVNSKVKKGNKIGSVGSTGFSTGPHLHFEIWKNGDDVDPMSYFKKV